MPQRQRVFFKLRVREGQADEYVRRHEDIYTHWPEVLQDLESAGVTRMTIHMQGCDAFLTMECVDYEQAKAHLEDAKLSPKSVEWETFMEPIMMSATDEGGSYDAAAPYPDGLPCVFDWPPKEAREKEEDVSRARDILSGLHLGFLVGAVFGGLTTALIMRLRRGR